MIHKTFDLGTSINDDALLFIFLIKKRAKVPI